MPFVSTTVSTTLICLILYNLLKISPQSKGAKKSCSQSVPNENCWTTCLNGKLSGQQDKKVMNSMRRKSTSQLKEKKEPGQNRCM